MPGEPVFAGVADPTTLVVTETVLDFVPGGAAAYWDGYKALDAETAELAQKHGLNGNGAADDDPVD